MTGRSESESTTPRARSVLTVAYAGWRDHRPFVAFSALVFLLGTLAGVGLDLSGVDLFGALGLDSVTDLFPETITAVTILLNNTRAFLLFVAGALTLGLLTVLALVFNGVVVGYVMSGAAAEKGFLFVVLGLVPHGVLELPALFVASGVAFRLVYVVPAYLIGRRNRVLNELDLKRTIALVGVAWVVLAVAAFVEFYVTGGILQAVFGTSVG